MSNSPGSVTPGTLRARLEDMAAQGRTLTVREAIAVIVPLCVAAAELHQRGVRSFLHPSSVFERPDGTFAPVAEHGQSLPQLAKDIACCAPEYHRVGAGDARASVYSVTIS